MADQKGDIYDHNNIYKGIDDHDDDDVSKKKQPFESSSSASNNNKHGSNSLKSDISTEIGPLLSNSSFKTDAKATRRYNVTSPETHDSQHMTESSCSNSLSITLPVLSNHQSFQDASKEAYLFRNFSGSTGSSNLKGVERWSEEPVTASSESCVSAQIARKAISNARARNSLNYPAVISAEISGESETMLSLKGKLLETSESSMMKPSKVFVKDEDTFVVAGFDLNEDINENGNDDPVFVQPVVATTIPSRDVIHVVAKAAVPRGSSPIRPLRFEGQQGWKGSAKTSAFRPTSLCKNLHVEACAGNHIPKDTQGFMGIDLNVAAVEDEGVSSPSKFKRTKRPSIDLNCLYEAADECAQPKLENTRLVDLNLNVNASIGDASKQDYNFARCDYLADLSTTQHLANNAQTQQYLVALPNMLLQPVQPNLPFLPSHSYPYKGPFPFGTRESLPSSGQAFSGTIPYAIYSHETGLFHGTMNPGISPTSLGTPHFVQATSKKRKEPEPGGRMEHYQPGYRQVT